jgi:hypothetical protein
MLRTIALLSILLSCLGHAFAATKTPDKVGSCNCPAQTTQPDKRGTLDSPLMVDARAVHSDKEAAQEAQRVAEQQRVNTWSIRLTFVIAVCAFLQFGGIVAQVVVYLKQTKVMRDTLAAISKQATTMDTQATDARKASAESAKFATDTLEEMKAQRLQMAGAMGKQAYEMGEQSAAVRSSARAAQEGAKAALLNAESLISAERAWVLASIRKTVTPYPYTSMIRMPDIVKCELIFKNYGATPAIIESFSSKTEWAFPVFEFPLPPQYGERKDARIILGPQEEKVIGTVFPVELLPDTPIDHARFTFDRAVFMGYVNYGGIFEGERGTKFCFGFDAENDSFIPIGPPPYNEIT